ncbi:unnamed protein product [Ostreobium quekettii]|uniref:Uncharacterized protein n=1 Tax=Ostreobium quekettii TaxID=121088 RepID=A0A8S1ITV9_9CHLO|nr:unnamed protein product [Ostreobium quekettii]
MLDVLAAPVCMVYGKEDPWIVPLWAQRLKRRVPQADYFELSPAGHCPHHEAPGAVNSVVARWVGDMEAGGRLCLQVGDSWRERCPITGRDVSVSILNGDPKTVLERIDAAFYRLVYGDGAV